MERHFVKLQKFLEEFCFISRLQERLFIDLISTSTGNGFCSIMASTPRCGRGDLCSIHSRGNPIRKATFGTECKFFFASAINHSSHVGSRHHIFLPVRTKNLPMKTICYSSVRICIYSEWKLSFPPRKKNTFFFLRHTQAFFAFVNFICKRA